MTRILDPKKLSELWGEKKNSNKKMDYDKLSRALRYYYEKGIIQKIPNVKYAYRYTSLDLRKIRFSQINF